MTKTEAQAPLTAEGRALLVAYWASLPAVRRPAAESGQMPCPAERA